MATEIWKLEKDLCRCCHAEGAFDNLVEPRIYLEQKEVYSEMLRECFDIIIPPVPGELCAVTYTICKNCIVRLREASSFKKQVLDCEARFMDMYCRKSIQVSNSLEMTVVKEEISDSFEMDFKTEEIEEPDDLNDIHTQDDDDISEDYEQTSKKVKKSMVRRSSRTKVRKEEPKEETNSQSDDNEEFRIDIDEDNTLSEGDNSILRSMLKIKQAKKKATKQSAAVKKKTKENVEKKGSTPVVRRLFCLPPEDYTHDGMKFKCNKCDKVYDKMDTLRRHIKSVHYKLTQYICPICNEGFMTNSQIILHKLKEHNIDDRYHCDVCDCVFNDKVRLQNHIKGFHKLGAKIKCNLCDYETHNETALYRHKFKHKTVKDQHCRFCKKSFLRRATMLLHERIHTGEKRNVCKECGQAFVQKASLNYHMAKYHPEVNF